MRFSTSLTSFLLASIATASPIAVSHSALVQRDLCQVGIPCVVQYEVNTALSAVNRAAAEVQADVKAVAAPTGPVIVALNASATVLVNVALELQAKVGPLVGDAKTQLSAYVVAAIRGLVHDIKAGVAIVTNIANDDAASVSIQVTEAAGAVLSAVAAIEAVVGSCDVSY